VIAVGFLLALLAFAAFTAAAGRMLLGPSDLATPGEDAAALRPTVIAPLLFGLLAVAALGISTGPLATLLRNAASIIGAP
jgi:hydrogenase-4 component F